MNESICSLGVEIRDVLVAINHKPFGVAFIVDENKKLCGVLSDGDIRRLLISGVEINTILSKELLNSEFVYGEEQDSVKSLLSKTNEKIRVIPIVNSAFEPVDYFKYEHQTHFTPVAKPELEGKELDYLLDAFLSTWISSKGEYINKFEESFSKFCNTKHGVAVSNGTTALHLSLVALGVEPGDEVIIPDLTFAATANCVLHAGATPVIVDIEEDYWTIDPKEIKKAITPKTKAIIPVHIYGQPCDMDPIMDIAKEHNLYVVEDCAEAHGAKYKGRPVGSIGDIGCFSFFANKIVTTGEGGICTTNNSELDSKIRLLRDHGMSRTKKYWHDVVGYNYRMTNLQAAIGCAQIERIEKIINQRNDLEQLYKEIFKDSLTYQLTTDKNREKVVWMIACLVDNRDEIISKLQEHNIESRPFFYPMTEMDLYKEYAHSSNPISKKISKIGINLPTSCELTKKEIENIVNVCF